MAKKNSEVDATVYLQNSAKTLATNIRFASVDNPVSTLVVTSSIPNEGKSTIAVALSEALASGGKTVLLIESDMRRRSLANMLNIHVRSGIYSVLSGQVPLNQAVVQTSMRGVYFLDAEPHIPNPVDILSSKRYQNFLNSLRETYDYVVIDTPPLTAFIDGAVVGSIVDGVVLVVRRNFVKRNEVVSSYEQLKKAGANVLGTCLNFCDGEKSEYYYEYYTKDGVKKKRKKKHNSGGDAPVPTSAPVAPAPAPAYPAPAPSFDAASAYAAPAAPAPAPNFDMPMSAPTAAPSAGARFSTPAGYEAAPAPSAAPQYTGSQSFGTYSGDLD